MNNKVYVAVISLAFFLVLIFSATFAYFYADVQNDNPLTVGASTPTMYSMMFDSSGEIELNIREIDMLELRSNMVNAIANDNLNLSISLKSGSVTDKVNCTYNITFFWDSDVVYTEADKELLDGEYEFSFVGTNLEEKDLSSLNWVLNEETNKYSAVVYENESIETNLVDGLTKEYTVEAKFYNIDAPQDRLEDTILYGHFDFTDVDCKVQSNYQGQ